jgi:hypothetical protein
MLVGVDWGGTKIEAIALEPDGRSIARLREETPRSDYEGMREGDRLAKLVWSRYVDRVARGLSVVVNPSILTSWCWAVAWQISMSFTMSCPRDWPRKPSHLSSTPR